MRTRLQIVFNKGAVMVLLPTSNKASGLKAALDDLVRASWSNRRRRKRPHIPFAKTFASDHVRRHQLPVLLHRGAPRASALANATASGPCRTTLAVRNALSFLAAANLATVLAFSIAQ